MPSPTPIACGSVPRRARVLLRPTLFVIAGIVLAACSAVQPIVPQTTASIAPVAAASPSAVASAPAPSTASPSAATAAASSPAASGAAPSAAAASQAPLSAASAAPATAGGNQPYLIKGSFTYSNDIITTYYVEQAVALVDMYGFVTRDQRWEVPVQGQTLGYLTIDQQKKQGTYELQLPERPAGTPVDVDNNGKQDAGVQIFAVSYWPNLVGSPFSVGDDRSRGWPSYLASTVNDTENKDEVTGGKLVVWAPDDKQQFPTGFGADGLLFTKDDPVGAVPAGYSIIDLNKQPFGISQEPQPDITLNEPNDAAIKDFSQLSYTAAFDKMFAQVRKEYAFNGIAGKAPNWDQLYGQIQPRVAQAERNKDGKAFYLALRDFTLAFRDGHVGLGGGEFAQQVFAEQAGAGYGFAVRQLDDGRVLVVYVTPNGPAAQAGMQVGAEVTAFNNTPIKQAIDVVTPLGGPFSTDFARNYQQQRYLTRAPLGTKAGVTFTNPGKAQQTATLTAVEERQSFAFTSLTRGSDPNALPVEYRLLDSGVGYVKINSNYDDLGLIVRLFERALTTFEQNQAPGVIIDLRQNSGGAPLGLAGFLTNQTIDQGQLQYYSEKTGRFEAEGLPEQILPNERQFKFPKLALLVNQSCYSACELEAYGFSKVPGMIVIGQYPTAGVEAEVSRGQYQLPDGLSLQVPTGRFINPDGSIFLEGSGVQPTQRVPINQETALSDQDVVLQAANKAITGQ